MNIKNFKLHFGIPAILIAFSGIISVPPCTAAAIPGKNTPYEYIVVGSGAGGGVVAARLAKNGRTVLLIEAGDDSGGVLNATVPVFHAYSTEDPLLAWDFYVNHYDDQAQAVQDSKFVWQTPSGALYRGSNPPSGSVQKGILYPRTATLGGCTVHNAMVAVYPNEADWNYIAQITGDQTWNPSHMRDLFKLLEKNQYTKIPSPDHGYNGYLATSTTPVSFGIADEKVLAISLAASKVMSGPGILSAIAGTIGNEANIVFGDLNSGNAGRDQTTGVWQIPINVNQQTGQGRRSSARDFILDVWNAKNDDGSQKYPLDIMLNALATKIIFNKNTTIPTATGVEVMSGKSLYRADPRASSSGAAPAATTISATKEVILSGGAYNSPQLLKLSGVGPRAELSKFGIPIIKDLPGVGTNLQDHFEIGVTHTANSDFSTVNGCTFGKGADPCLDEWKSSSPSAIYSFSNGFPYGVIAKSSVATQDSVYSNDPDVFLFGGIANFKGYYPGYSNDVYGHDNWTWVILKAHTGNQAGTVLLNSADPRDVPSIHFNYFSDANNNNAGQRDLTAMSEGVALARQIMDNVFIPLNPPNFKEQLPGTQFPNGSPSLTQHIKNEAWSHHASCTNPIGGDNDPMAVLDSKFRVRGVKGLRVVDASVFPRVPGYFLAVPTYMIGEKAAESILNNE